MALGKYQVHIYGQSLRLFCRKRATRRASADCLGPFIKPMDDVPLGWLGRGCPDSLDPWGEATVEWAHGKCITRECKIIINLINR